MNRLNKDLEIKVSRRLILQSRINLIQIEIRELYDELDNETDQDEISLIEEAIYNKRIKLDKIEKELENAE